MHAVWPVKSRQMSIKVAQKWFHQENETSLQKLPKNVGDLGQINVATGY